MVSDQLQIAGNDKNRAWVKPNLPTAKLASIVLSLDGWISLKGVLRFMDFNFKTLALRICDKHIML